MSLEHLWLAVLGLVLGGWFVLDGANLGLGMSLRRLGRTGTERRIVLTALGPFLLGGEVWLVAAAGLLIGTLPGLEKDLLFAYYPWFVTILVAWVLRDMGVWLRSRRPSPRWRTAWERVVVAASTVFAFGWGAVLGAVVQGVPHGERAGLGTLVGPYSLLWGATVVAVFALHGAVFTAMRVPDGLRERAAALAARRVTPALLLSAMSLAFGAAFADTARPWAGAVLGVVALGAILGAGASLRRGRLGRAYACTAASALLPLLAVGVAVAPRLLEGAASGDTLRLLAGLALPVIPILLAVQAWMWWTFRHRVSSRSVVFF